LDRDSRRPCGCSPADFPILFGNLLLWVFFLASISFWNFSSCEDVHEWGIPVFIYFRGVSFFPCITVHFCSGLPVSYYLKCQKCLEFPVSSLWRDSFLQQEGSIICPIWVAPQ
jgi:hypothetical protein